MSDLIERLRSKTILVNKYDVSKAMFEAADEIEQVTAAFTELTNALEKHLGPGNPSAWIAEVERLRGALEEIAHSKYCNYDNTGAGQYGIGVADGHRFCSNIAKQVLKEREDGVFITAYDNDFTLKVEAIERSRRKFRNAYRELAKVCNEALEGKEDV